MQTTADVSKFFGYLAVENVASFTKNRFYQKLDYVTMNNYV